MSDASISHAASAAPAQRAFGERRFGAINRLGLLTLLRKEIRRFLKVPAQTVIAPVVSTLLFLLVFIQALGGQRAPIAGVPYVEFLAPGLIMMAILTNAFANSSSSIIIGKVQGSIVDVLMPPLSAFELTIGFVFGAAARGLLVAVVTAATSAVFMYFGGTPMRFEQWWAIAYFSLIASMIFGMLGVIGGVWADKFDQLAVVTNFIITPLTFLSGTFYAVSALPEPFATLSHFNPVFYLLDGFRYGFTGVSESPIVIAALASALVAALLGYASYALLKSGYKLKA